MSTTQQVLLGLVTATGPTVYFLDHFTGADGTNLTSHTPDIGSAWTINTGATTIQSNKASSPADSVVSVDMGQADGIITCSMDSPLANNDAIVFRKVDSSNYFRFQVNAIGVPANTTAYLIETSGGSDSLLVANGITMTNGLHTWRLELNGTSIGAYIDGVLVATTTSSVRQTATIHGFASSNALGTGGTLTDDYQMAPP